MWPSGFELLNTNQHEVQGVRSVNYSKDPLQEAGCLWVGNPRGLGRGKFEPGGQAEQIWSQSILGLFLFCRSGRCWLVSRVPGRVHLKCKIFFWLIKVKSNESDVEQVQRGYCNYGENDGAACDEKWRAFFCVVKQARGWEGVFVVGVRSVRSHPNRNQTTTNHASNISRKMP